MTELLTPQELADRFTAKFGGEVTDLKVKEWGEGVSKVPKRIVRMKIPAKILNDAVKELVSISFPHLAVISGSDTGEHVELQYHFTVYFGEKHKEIEVSFCVPLLKSDLRVPTISAVIPGAVYSEREKQEMLGIIVTDIPDPRGLFLPADFPDGVYPWRKDETGVPEDMVNKLFAVGRPTDRPAPPVPPKEKPETKKQVNDQEKLEKEEKTEIKPDIKSEIKEGTSDE